MASATDSIFGPLLHGEVCCCGVHESSNNGYCARCHRDGTASGGAFETGLDHGFASNYDGYDHEFTGMISPRQTYQSMLDLQGEAFEDEFGSYASVNGNLSHVGSLDFDELETYSSVAGISCTGDTREGEEITEADVSDGLEVFGCIACGNVGCICLPANCGDLSVGIDADWGRRGPLARFRFGRWFRRRGVDADKKQRGLDSDEGLVQQRGVRLGLARFNPWRRRHASELCGGEDEKMAAKYGWGMGIGMGMGMGRLRQGRARRVRVVQDRPMKRQFFLILSVVCVLFCALFWRELGLRRMVLRAMRVEAEETLCRRSNLSAGPWRYCGPHNGHDFSRTPLDTMDATCAQHDFCIEKSEYLIEGRARKLYPMGTQDEDDFLRCGIPMRSHTDPNFGCQINACDAEMFNSLHGGFACSDDPSLPKSAWCGDKRFAGRAVCSEYGLSLRFFACKAVARMSKAYHGWKIRTTCAFISQHLQHVLESLDDDEEDDDEEEQAEVMATGRRDLGLDPSKPRRRRPWSLVTRLAGSLWATLRRGRTRPSDAENAHAAAGGTYAGPGNAYGAPPWGGRAGGWNCTCQLPEQVRFKPPANVQKALRMWEAPQ